MLDPVIGYQTGQRVISLKSRLQGGGPFEGVIESVVVPAKGKRFVVIRDDQAGCHRRLFDEVAPKLK